MKKTLLLVAMSHQFVRMVMYALEVATLHEKEGLKYALGDSGERLYNTIVSGMIFLHR